MSGPLKTVGTLVKKSIAIPAGVLGLKKPKAPALPSPPGMPMRDEAAAAADRADALRRRQGRASTQLLGVLGEEAGNTATKLLLGN